MYNDTIAAIATGITNAGIGIIRVSGPNAISVIDNIYLSPIPLIFNVIFEKLDSIKNLLLLFCNKRLKQPIII